MRKTDRHTGILLALQNGRMTGEALAARFEVSRRTILRDIDALSQVGVPIVALPGSGGGFEIAGDYWLAPLQLTPDEAALVLLALESFGPAANSPFGDARRTVEEKLRASLPDRVVADAERANAAIDLPGPHRHERLGYLSAIRTVVTAGQWIRIGYQSTSRHADHDILPRRLTLQHRRWYLAAISVSACEFRSFRLDRITALSPIAPPVDSVAIVSAAERANAAPYEAIEVVAWVTARARRSLEDHPDLANELGPETAHGSELRFSTPRSEMRFFARELHALGPDVVVHSPPEFQALIVEIASATLAHYRQDNGDTMLSPIPS